MENNLKGNLWLLCGFLDGDYIFWTTLLPVPDRGMLLIEGDISPIMAIRGIRGDPIRAG